MLYDFHENIHESLYDLSDDYPGYITCTIATHKPPEENPYHLLLLADCYRDVVPSYISNHKGNILKLTTSNIKCRKLLERWKEHFKIFPHALISKLPNRQPLTGQPSHSCLPSEQLHDGHLDIGTLQAESLTTDESMASYRYDDMAVEFSKADSTVRFKIHSGTEILDWVNGSFTVMKTDIAMADLLRPLDILDDPESSKIVTVIVMAATDSCSGELLTLYKFAAGEIKDNPESLGENWMLFKVELTNDEVFAEIQELCRQKFFTHLDEGLEEKWEEESPLFIVIASIPINDEKPFHVEPIEPDFPISGTERKAYIFRHPESNQLFFKVYEPASPSDVEGYYGSARDGSSNYRSFSMAGATSPGQYDIETQVRVNTVNQIRIMLWSQYSCC